MEPVTHSHTCSHATHTRIDLGLEMVLYCPGDGIRRQLQIRSVGFPLTFSKTCKKCPFHYWLNNVIWAPTGPNRSRQRQSSTHMLRINQITEGEWGEKEREKEGKKERHRQTLRGLIIFPFLTTSTPPFLLLPPLLHFLNSPNHHHPSPQAGSVLDLSQY